MTTQTDIAPIPLDTLSTPTDRPAYVRDTYLLRRYEVVAPHVRNDGSESDYAGMVRAGLIVAGFSGWTEMQTVGYWLGKFEPGTTFVVYAEPMRSESPGDLPIATREILARLARDAMPDQDAVQVVEAPHDVVLVEA